MRIHPTVKRKATPTKYQWPNRSETSFVSLYHQSLANTWYDELLASAKSRTLYTGSAACTSTVAGNRAPGATRNSRKQPSSGFNAISMAGLPSAGGKPSMVVPVTLRQRCDSSPITALTCLSQSSCVCSSLSSICPCCFRKLGGMSPVLWCLSLNRMYASASREIAFSFTALPAVALRLSNTCERRRRSLSSFQRRRPPETCLSAIKSTSFGSETPRNSSTRGSIAANNCRNDHIGALERIGRNATSSMVLCPEVRRTRICSSEWLLLTIPTPTEVSPEARSSQYRTPYGVVSQL